MFLKTVELLIGIAILGSGLCMWYYNHRAYRNLSPDLDETDMPLPGRVKDDDYSELGRVTIIKARRWQYIMWVTAVVGGIIIVILSELLT